MALEQNVSMLNRSLVMDRLQNDQPGKRLRGVMDATYMATEDPDIAMALLDVALNDRVATVRSAAIESLGAQINTPTIGVQLMQTLQNAESPLVQLALVDLVLRNGNDEQVDQLLQLCSVLTQIALEITDMLMGLGAAGAAVHGADDPALFRDVGPSPFRTSTSGARQAPWLTPDTGEVSAAGVESPFKTGPPC